MVGSRFISLTSAELVILLQQFLGLILRQSALVAIVVSWVVPAFSLHNGLVDELDFRATSFYQLDRNQNKRPEKF